MEPLDYELIEPQQRCFSRDGHSPAEVFRWGGTVPVQAFCARCGQRYTVVTSDSLTG